MHVVIAPLATKGAYERRALHFLFFVEKVAFSHYRPLPAAAACLFGNRAIASISLAAPTGAGSNASAPAESASEHRPEPHSPTTIIGIALKVATLRIRLMSTLGSAGDIRSMTTTWNDDWVN